MRLIFFAMNALLVGMMLVFVNCGDENPVDSAVVDNSPAFSGVALGSTCSTYVAYVSPDRSARPDTVKLSFKYNSSKVKSIRVQATLDSQKTWITISTITPNSSNAASVVWVPSKESDDIINYFGRKSCLIRISDSTLNESEYLTSTEFFVIGTMSFILYSPLGGESFNSTDTVKILFSRNSDLSANISVCYTTTYADADPTWEQTFRPIKQLSKNIPIYNFEVSFVPKELADERPSIDLSNPLVILLADYGSGGKRIATGNITIN